MGFGETPLECLCSGYELIEDENLDNQLYHGNMMCDAPPTSYKLMQACILEISEYNTCVFDICLDVNLLSCSNYTIN